MAEARTLCKPDPQGIRPQRLPNGDTVITNWLGHGHDGDDVPIFQVTREKKVVWRYLDCTQVPLVVSVQVLDQGYAH